MTLFARYPNSTTKVRKGQRGKEHGNGVEKVKRSRVGWWKQSLGGGEVKENSCRSPTVGIHAVALPRAAWWWGRGQGWWRAGWWRAASRTWAAPCARPYFVWASNMARSISRYLAARPSPRAPTHIIEWMYRSSRDEEKEKRTNNMYKRDTSFLLYAFFISLCDSIDKCDQATIFILFDISVDKIRASSCYLHAPKLNGEEESWNCFNTGDGILFISKENRLKGKHRRDGKGMSRKMERQHCASRGLDVKTSGMSGWKLKGEEEINSIE